MKRLLRCPRCGGPLRAAPRLLRCAECGPYPVLGSVPVLVPDPAGWCATFRDAALASLAEHGLSTRAEVETLTAFADAAPAGEPSRFGDDWARHELEGTAPPSLVAGPADDALAELLALSETASPARWLVERVPAQASVLELGCGAGVLSEQLARKTKRLVVADLSLRAVLTARARSRAPLGVVLDAQALPFADGAFEVLLAENVVDLLDDQPAFFEGAARVARRVLISTPDPSKGGDLSKLASSAGLKELERSDGIPWTRRLSARHLEVYLVQLRAFAAVSRRRAKASRRGSPTRGS